MVFITINSDKIQVKKQWLLVHEQKAWVRIFNVNSCDQQTYNDLLLSSKYCRLNWQLFMIVNKALLIIIISSINYY